MSIAISKGYSKRIFSSFCNSPSFSLLLLSTNCASDVTGRLTFLIGPKFPEPSSLIRRRAREENRRVTVGAGKRGKKTARDCFRPYSLFPQLLHATLSRHIRPPPLLSSLHPSLLSSSSLSACSPTLPSSTSTLRPRHRSGEHGQPDNRAQPSPVRRLSRRHGGLPLPPRTPPPRLRSHRAPSAVGSRCALLHRRITQRLLLGELQSAFVVRLRVERRRTTV